MESNKHASIQDNLSAILSHYLTRLHLRLPTKKHLMARTKSNADFKFLVRPGKQATIIFTNSFILAVCTIKFLPFSAATRQCTTLI